LTIYNSANSFDEVDLEDSKNLEQKVQVTYLESYC